MNVSLPGPVAVACGAGFGRASGQVGMLRALREAGVEADIAVGSSLGALNAAGVALRSPTAVEDLEKMWADIGKNPIANVTRAVIRSLAQGQSAKQARQVQEIVNEVVPDVGFADLPASLALVGTDLETGLVRNLDSGPVRTAVAASSALPGLFPPVKVDGRPIIDGGLVEALPVDLALDLGAGSLVVLDVGAPGVDEEAARDLRWWGVGTLAYVQLIRNQVSHALIHAARRIPVVVISTDHGSPLDFTSAGDMIAAGHRAAVDALGALPTDMARPGLYGLPKGLEHNSRLQKMTI